MKYNNSNFKQKYSNMINIISLQCYDSKLLLIEDKQLLIKKKKDCFDFGLIYNVKWTIFMHLSKFIIKYTKKGRKGFSIGY